MDHKWKIIGTILAFSAGFGAVLATRLDASAIAAVLGAVCALAFGVPATIIATAIVLRYRQRLKEQQKQQEWRPPMMQQQPPVVIVPPAQYPQLGYGYRPWSDDEFTSAPFNRQFTVIGEEDD